LVADQNEFIVTFLCNLAEVGDGFGDKLQFLQAIDLKIGRGFFDDCTVAVYK
jgi:hypothetical protein